LQFLQRDKHAPLPLLPQKNVNLAPKKWEPRDQPLPGSFPKKDPGYEVASDTGKIGGIQGDTSTILSNMAANWGMIIINYTGSYQIFK
jgi:hypothetical protein